jgi:hypothetical protein
MFGNLFIRPGQLFLESFGSLASGGFKRRLRLGSRLIQMCSQASISRRIRGSYSLCKYSTFKGITAGLIVFQTVFVFPVKDTRTKSAKIKVGFTQTIPSRGHPTKLPKVMHRFPQLQQQSVATASQFTELPMPTWLFSHRSRQMLVRLP